LFATMIALRLLQYENTSCPRLVTLAPIMTLIRLPQDVNAPCPMLVTLSEWCNCRRFAVRVFD